MHKVIKDIEDILRAEYSPIHALFFLGRGPDDSISIDEFNRAIELEVPSLMSEYYQWMMQVDFGITTTEHIEYFESSDEIKYPYNQNYDSYFDCDNQTMSLTDILQTTNIWREIQQEQPDREWQSGFLTICEWSSAYVMVIDTRGEVTNKGAILYWNYKGDSTYRIRYDNFESYLITKLELLKKNLYFPTDFKDINGNEDFHYGKTRAEIDATIASLNSTFCVDFNADLPSIPQISPASLDRDNLINRKVKIVTGPFKSLTGTIISLDGDRFNIAVEIFGVVTQTTLEEQYIEIL